jgi:hypothetical protein
MSSINYNKNVLGAGEKKKDIFAFLRKIIAPRLREWF